MKIEKIFRYANSFGWKQLAWEKEDGIVIFEKMHVKYRRFSALRELLGMTRYDIYRLRASINYEEDRAVFLVKKPRERAVSIQTKSPYKIKLLLIDFDEFFRN